MPFKTLLLKNVKVIIIVKTLIMGQIKLMVLNFSVNYGIKKPTITDEYFKELQSDVGFQIPNHEI